jgi:hypothetical protein
VVLGKCPPNIAVAQIGTTSSIIQPNVRKDNRREEQRKHTGKRDNQQNLPISKLKSYLLNGFQSGTTQRLQLILHHLVKPIISNILVVIISQNSVIWIIVIGFGVHNGRLFTSNPKEMIWHNCTTGEILNKIVRIKTRIQKKTINRTHLVENIKHLVNVPI